MNGIYLYFVNVLDGRYWNFKYHGHIFIVIAVMGALVFHIHRMVFDVNVKVCVGMVVE